MIRLSGTLGLLLLLFTMTARAGKPLSDSLSYSAGISAGLGVIMLGTDDIASYVNARFAPAQRVEKFNAAAEFSTVFEFHVTPEWIGKIEYAYMLKSFGVPSGFGPEYTIGYDLHAPTLLLDYFTGGTGYFLKAGGGIGYHVAHYTQNVPGEPLSWSASGAGIKLEAEGNTRFDDHLYADIAVELRGEFLGKLSDDSGNPLVIPGGDNASMNMTGAGLRFGLSYFF